MGAMYVLSSRANVDDLKSIENKSNFVSADNMPNYVKGAFISMEDERFYKHHGFDLKGTTRALFSTISDRDVQGGSTITQQVVKNYYYDNERSFTRKIKELFVAHKVEQQYNKNEILSFMLIIFIMVMTNIHLKVLQIIILEQLLIKTIKACNRLLYCKVLY